MAVSLACRVCRVSMAAPKGCAVCDKMRKNLVSFEEVEQGPGGDRPALSTMAGDGLAALRERMRFYKKGLAELPASETYTKSLIAVTNSLAKLLEAARRLQEDGVSAVQNMSFIEKAELFIGWYGALPPAYRGNLREKMESWEAQVGKPVSRADLALAAPRGEE